MRRLRLLVTSAVVSVFAALGIVASAEAANDYILEINGVQGESGDAKMPNAVTPLSYSWGASHAGRNGVPRLGDFSITKRVDFASPQLFQRLVQAQQIPSMELHVRNAGGDQQTFLRYCFQNVVVSSIQHAGNPADIRPAENVTFRYTAVTERYFRQNPDGSLGTSVFAGWNATTGQLITTYPDPCG
jgi:type VI secretion system secreted protein Hcp